MDNAARLKIVTIVVGVICALLSGTISAQTITQVHVFTNSPDGAYPAAVLAQGRDGNLYGTTGEGGSNVCNIVGYQTGCGTVFKIDTSGNVTILHSFTDGDGFYPQGLILAEDGNFYGTAVQGGAYNLGTLFKVTASGVFTKLHDFANLTDGELPGNQLLQASDGNLYGLSKTGLFRATTSGAVTTLLALGIDPSVINSDPVIQGTNGDLYATLPWGYCTGNYCPCGSLVKFNLQGIKISEHGFSCYNTTVGASPSTMIQGTDGNFYGTAGSASGSAQYGTVFQLDARTGNITVLHDFDSTADAPEAGLIQGSDGNFYGVLSDGYPFMSGAAYEIAPDGTYTALGNLPNNGEDFPMWPLMQQTAGKFYGNLPFSEETYYAYYGAIYAVDNGLGPFITFVAPQGRVGSRAQILGQGLTGATSVTFNGLATTSFTVVSDTFMTAVVPVGATSGAVVVTAPSGTLTSNKSFRVSAW